jgi:hypothetical protein
MFLLKDIGMSRTNVENSVRVDIRPLKQFVAERFPETPLREILLLEDDKMDVNSFIIKVQTWFQLLQWVKKEGKHYGSI